MIELVELGKRFGAAVAVEGLSLRVERGELLVLVGGSGSGKTTTLKMINRLVEPSSGVVRIVRAGHPPPLLRLPDGQAEVLEVPGGPLLGIDTAAHFPESELRLVPGSVLALYTDGLIERRDSNIDSDVDRLRASLARMGGGRLEDLADALLRTTDRPDMPPGTDLPPPPEDPGRIWVRVERQTLSRVPGADAVLFTVHTRSRTVAEVCADAERARRLHAALVAMGPEMRAYKAIDALAAPVLGWLEERGAGRS